MAKKDYKYVAGQDELKYVYDHAMARTKSHPDHAAKCHKIVDAHRSFKTEKEALKLALKLKKKDPDEMCQVWAKIGTDEEYYLLTDWLVTRDFKIAMDAEYIGWHLMYDDTRLDTIIYAGVPIDDVVAYK